MYVSKGCLKRILGLAETEAGQSAMNGLVVCDSELQNLVENIDRKVKQWAVLCRRGLQRSLVGETSNGSSLMRDFVAGYIWLKRLP